MDFTAGMKRSGWNKFPPCDAVSRIEQEQQTNAGQTGKYLGMLAKLSMAKGKMIITRSLKWVTEYGSTFWMQLHSQCRAFLSQCH